MRPLERVPAVRRIDTDREDAFAVEITGEFYAADAENLFGLLEGAFAIHDRVDLLVRLSGIEEIDLSELSGETATMMREEVARHVGRCAVIGDGWWSSRVTRLFEPSSGVESRHFEPDREQEAWEWISAREVEDKI